MRESRGDQTVHRSLYIYIYIYILLTVHHGTIFTKTNLTQVFNVFIYFHFYTSSEQPSAHHQENQLYQ